MRTISTPQPSLARAFVCAGGLLCLAAWTACGHGADSSEKTAPAADPHATQPAATPLAPEAVVVAPADAAPAKTPAAADPNPATPPGEAAAPPKSSGEGQACSRGGPCPNGLTCVGTLAGASSTCQDEARAKKECAKRGGEWGNWGMTRDLFCMGVYKDGGKACTDGSQCEGSCLSPHPDGKPQCQKYELQFGCFSKLTKGKKEQAICQD